eukprot:TRINITY_DN7567_c0_g1_i1.p1 TRINITY_DN7567_c0_g1~~TRINITY_DN7567_c0_g1_i1.p1  ORF type:complete len:534 (-),score=125.93 TRINITY_DN7567_c0_g1_i1:22-1623(-)
MSSKPLRPLSILLVGLVYFVLGWVYVALFILLISVYHRYFYFHSTKKDGISVEHPLLRASAFELAAKIKNREIRSSELVEIHIKQMEYVNPILNAMVANRFKEARQAARLADELMLSIPAEELPPLHGVPFSVKEAISLTGMPNSSGLLSRKDHISTKDATVVSRLRKAGAIPIGVTNVSELCMWMESNNLVYGRTNNPYDTSRIVGGSSGGEGATVCSCTPFGVGSDIGGSLRMPAFFCGIFTHKPTGGLVPNEGQFPISRNEALRYLTTGILCKHAKDLLPLLHILVGEDQFKYSLKPVNLNLSTLNIMSVRQGPKRFFVEKVSSDLTKAQIAVENYFSSKGATVTVVEHLNEFAETLEIWSACLSVAGNDDFAFSMGNCKYHISSGIELLKWLLGIPSHTLPAIGLSIIEKLPKLFPSLTKKDASKLLVVKKNIIDKLGSDGVLLYPTYPRVAPKHNKPLLPPFNWVHTAIFNVLEFPVTNVPLGLNHEGLPLGIQVASIPGNDALTIAIAERLEEQFGGWVPPNNPNSQ